MCQPGRLSAPMLTFVALATAASASADTIRVPLSAFSGTEGVVQFTVPPQPLPYVEDGVAFTYSPPFGYIFPPTGAMDSPSLNLQFPGDSPTTSGTLTVTFSRPVNLAGFDIWMHPDMEPPSVEVALFADAVGLQPVGALNLGSYDAFEGDFLGFASSAVFTRAEFKFTISELGSSWQMDDFRFDNAAPIPEPGTVSLTLLGLALIGRRLARRTGRRRTGQ